MSGAWESGPQREIAFWRRAELLRLVLIRLLERRGLEAARTERQPSLFPEATA